MNKNLIENEDFQIVTPSENGLFTIATLNTNSKSNSGLLEDFQNVDNIPIIPISTNSCFDLENLPTTDTLNDLLTNLCELMIRFDGSVKDYQKSDYEHLVKTITNALIKLYADSANINLDIETILQHLNNIGDVATKAYVDTACANLQSQIDSLTVGSGEAELWPTLTPPYLDFSIGYSGFKEVGDEINVVFTTLFNRGTISPAYGTDGLRAGSLIGYQYEGLEGIHHVKVGANIWTCLAGYAAGPQPVGSKGTPYGTALEAGYTSTKTITITGVYPIQATSVKIATTTKQTLQAHGTDIIVDLAGEDSSGNKQTVEIPQAWGTITKLYQYNTLSNNWDAINLTLFKKTETTLQINSNSVPYFTYTNVGSQIGRRKLKFTL